MHVMRFRCASSSFGYLAAAALAYLPVAALAGVLPAGRASASATLEMDRLLLATAAAAAVAAGAVAATLLRHRRRNSTTKASHPAGLTPPPSPPPADALETAGSSHSPLQPGVDGKQGERGREGPAGPPRRALNIMWLVIFVVSLLSIAAIIVAVVCSSGHCSSPSPPPPSPDPCPCTPGADAKAYIDCGECCGRHPGCGRCDEFCVVASPPAPSPFNDTAPCCWDEDDHRLLAPAFVNPFSSSRYGSSDICRKYYEEKQIHRDLTLEHLCEQMKEKEKEQDEGDQAEATKAALEALNTAVNLLVECSKNDCDATQVVQGVLAIATSLTPILALAAGPWAPVIGLFSELLAGWIGGGAGPQLQLTYEDVVNAVEEGVANWQTIHSQVQLGANARSMMSIYKSYREAWDYKTSSELKKLFEEHWTPSDSNKVFPFLGHADVIYHELVGESENSFRETRIANLNDVPRWTFRSDCESKCYPSSVPSPRNYDMPHAPDSGLCFQHWHDTGTADTVADDRSGIGVQWDKLSKYLSTFDLFMAAEFMFDSNFIGLWERTRDLDRNETGGSCTFDCNNFTRNQFLNERENLHNYWIKSLEARAVIDRCKYSDRTWALDQFCTGRGAGQCNYGGMSGVVCGRECGSYTRGADPYRNEGTYWSANDCTNMFDEMAKNNKNFGTVCGPTWAETHDDCMAPLKSDTVTCTGRGCCDSVAAGDRCGGFAKYRLCTSPVMCATDEPGSTYVNCGPKGFPINAAKGHVAFLPEEQRCGGSVYKYCSSSGWCQKEKDSAQLQGRSQQWAKRFDAPEDWNNMTRGMTCRTVLSSKAAWGL